MTQQRWLPGWTSGTTSSRGESDPQTQPAPFHTRLSALALHPTAPPLLHGLAVGVSAIMAEGLAVYLPTKSSAGNLFGVIFLLGILVVSTIWGFRLGLLMSLATALVYAHLHQLATGNSFTGADDWNAIAVFLIVAVSADAVAAIARSRL